MRPIDADALKETLSDLDCEANNAGFQSGMDFVLHDFMPKVIDAQPTIEPEVLMIKSDSARNLTDEETAVFEEWLNRDAVIEPEVRHGRWIEKEHYHVHGEEYCDCECSICCHRISRVRGYYPNYCEECGSMNGGADNG